MKQFLCALLTLSILPGPLSAAAQDPPPVAPDTAVTSSRETYRLRVENSQFGRIEISVDGGEHYLLIGRVTQPARAAASEKAVSAPAQVCRSSGEGIAIAIGPGQVLKLLPSSTTSHVKAAQGIIRTDMDARAGLFGEFLPPSGMPVQQQVSAGRWQPLPEAFSAAEDDVYGITVILPDSQAGSTVPANPNPAFLARLADVRKRLTAYSDHYTSRAAERARQARRPIVSGIVTLRPKLPHDEPEPITAVTYRIDGDIVSAQNSLPSEFGWDTARVPNGEHVIEIRALSKYATTVTRLRTLIFVNNQ